MEILGYIIRTRIKNAFGRGVGVWMSAGGAIGGLFAILYGLGFGYLAWQSSMDPDFQNEDFRGMISGVIAAMALFGVLKDFVPSYKRRPNLLPPLAPMSNRTRWMVNQASAYLNLFVLAFLLFGLSFMILGSRSPEGLVLGIIILCIVFISETASYILRTGFEYDLPGRLLWMIAAVGLEAVLPASVTLLGSSIPIWLPIVVLGGILGLSYMADTSHKGLRLSQVAADDVVNVDQALSRMVFRNDMVRRMLMLGLVFKLLVGVFLFVQLKDSKQNLFLIWEFKLLFLSPVLVFTYVFGNAWGFFGQLFMSLQRIRPVGRLLFSHYLKLLMVPLLLDFALSITGAVVMRLDMIETVALMLAATAICLAGGFAGSTFLPKRLDPSATLRRSQIHTGVSMGILLVLVAFCVGFAYDATRWWFVGGSIVLSALVLLFTFSKTEGSVHKLIGVVTRDG